MTSRHDPRRRPDDDHDNTAFDTFRQPVAPLAPPPGAFEDIRGRARARRKGRVLWTTVALAGCLAGGAVAVNATHHQSPSTVAVSSDDTPDETTGKSATGAEKSAPGAGGAAAAEPATCKTTELKVTLGAGQGAAGSQYRPLRITNNAGTTCFLYGFPGVSIVDSSGAQVGKPADREGPQASGKVILKPGQREQVTLRIVNAANYGDQCHLVDASGIRVYPPGEKHSVVLPVKGITGCTSESIETLTVTSFGVH